MKKVRFTWIAVLLAILMFAGCGGGSAKNSSNSGSYYAATEEAYREDVVGYAAEYDSNGVPAESKTSNSTSRSNIPDGVKIIYTASVEMETTTYDEALESLKKLTEDQGGYIENISSSQSGYYRYTSMTIRVPAENFRAFLDDSGNIAQILSSRENAKDVSEYYYDTENRLATEKTKLARLQELLRKADTMTDIIELENAISDTEYAIDDLSGTLRHYDSLVSFSTIDIRLSEVGVLRGQEVPAVTFAERLQKAWNTGCENALEGLQDFVLGFSEHWLGWIIFIAVIIIIILIIKRAVRRNRMRADGTLPKSRRELRREAKAAKKAEKAAERAAARNARRKGVPAQPVENVETAVQTVENAVSEAETQDQTD